MGKYLAYLNAVMVMKYAAARPCKAAFVHQEVNLHDDFQ